MIIVEKAKNGSETLKINNRYIHSKYDPIKEAKNFINSKKKLLDNKHIVVYGLGLGYHIQEILKLKSSKAKVYVFEANNELIEICKCNSYILKNKDLKIINLSNKFFVELSEVLSEVDDIIIHKPSLETIKESNTNIYNIIKNYEIAKASILKNKDILIENRINNKKIKCKKIKRIFEEFNYKKWIVTAAGPSLDYDINILKEKRKGYKIISVGTAVKTLLKNEIIPDIIVIIDGMDGVQKQLEGIKENNIPLCFLETASRCAVNEYKGPKYIFTNNDDDKYKITTGKTVAVAAIDIAIKCGAKEIVLLGQDLAYIDNKTHIKMFSDIYGIEDKMIFEKNKPKVKGINGEFLDTTQGYLYFKKQIENIIEDNIDIKFINCSKGAFITGAYHKKFELI